MEDKPKRLMMCLLVGLPVVMVGLGLTTAGDPRSKISKSYSLLVPLGAQAPAMPMPTPSANVPVYLPPNDPIIAVNRFISQGPWRQRPSVAAWPSDAWQVAAPRNEPVVVNRTASQGSWGQCPPGAALPGGTSAWYPSLSEPAMPVNATLPQGLSNLLPPSPASPADARLALPTDALAAGLTALPANPTTAPAASTQLKMLPFQEAHWQGLEAVPLTPSLKRALKILSDAQGVIIDEATEPADMEGFRAGDLIISVGQVPTPTLESFLKAADRVRDRRRTEIQLVRKSKIRTLVLTGYQQRLGTANGETAQMIRAGMRSPHGYLGACTNCHRIGKTGELALDQGDLLNRAAPTIRAGQTRPHRERGECTACHTMIR